MAKYAPLGTVQIQPRDLTIPTTYNPYSVPTFLEENLSFVDQCPVHPGSNVPNSPVRQVFPNMSGGGIPPKHNLIKTREGNQLQNSREPIRIAHNEAEPHDVRSRHISAMPPNQSQGFGAPTFRTNTKESTLGVNSLGQPQVLQRQYSPTGLPQHASWSGEGLSYMPTYPSGDQRPLPQVLPRGAEHHNRHQRQIGTNPSAHSAMVDVLNASTSEGYTTVSAVRHMRPATKQCC